MSEVHSRLLPDSLSLPAQQISQISPYPRPSKLFAKVEESQVWRREVMSDILLESVVQTATRNVDVDDGSHIETNPDGSSESTLKATSSPPPDNDDTYEGKEIKTEVQTETKYPDLKQAANHEVEESTETDEKNVHSTTPKSDPRKTPVQQGSDSVLSSSSRLNVTKKTDTKTTADNGASQDHSTAENTREETAPVEIVKSNPEEDNSEQEFRAGQAVISETVESAITPKDEPKELSTLSTERPSTKSTGLQEHRSDIANNDLRLTPADSLKLLHFDDDLSQYDGEKLWIRMTNRCRVFFDGRGPVLGHAIMSLQRLRRGNSDAETEFKVLCELAGYHKYLSTNLQKHLGILKGYSGESLLKAPFNIARLSLTLTPENSQNGCLTCVHKGRECRESYVVGSRCVNCHADEANGETITEADKCYWKCARLGLLTYPEAKEFFGYEDGISKGRKRGLTEENGSLQPRKLAKISESGRERFKTPRGAYPISLQHFRRLNHGQGYLVARIERNLFDVRGQPLRSGPTFQAGVNLNDFKSIRAALEWSMWDYIKDKGKIRLYTYRPKYIFEVRRRVHGKEESFTEEDFLAHDRQLAADRLSMVDETDLAKKTACVRPGFVFVCSAVAADYTP